MTVGENGGCDVENCHGMVGVERQRQNCSKHLSHSAQFHMPDTTHGHFTESFFSLWDSLRCACP